MRQYLIDIPDGVDLHVGKKFAVEICGYEASGRCLTDETICIVQDNKFEYAKMTLAPSLESRVAELERRSNSFNIKTPVCDTRPCGDNLYNESGGVKVQKGFKAIFFGKDYVVSDVRGNKIEFEEVKKPKPPKILTYEEWEKEYPINEITPSISLYTLRHNQIIRRSKAIEYARYLCKELGVQVGINLERDGRHRLCYLANGAANREFRVDNFRLLMGDKRIKLLGSILCV